MYASVKEWLNAPIELLPFIRRDGAGDKVLGQPMRVECYRVDEIKVVRNTQGIEVTSNSHIYLDGTQSISILDNIMLDGVETPIQAISTFYRNGVPDIKVVYL